MHIADEFFLTYPSKDVQLLIACCIADVLRVYAPEAPYKDPGQVKVGRDLLGCWKRLEHIVLNEKLGIITMLELKSHLIISEHILLSYQTIGWPKRS